MSNLYFEAAIVLGQVLNGTKSLKNVMYKNQAKHKSSFKKLYALLCKTIQHKQFLYDLLYKHEIFKGFEKKKFVLMAMLSEMVYGMKRIQGGGYLKRHLMQFWADMEPLIIEERQRVKDTKTVPGPLRYVRINTLKEITEDIIKQLVEEEEFTKVTFEQVQTTPKSTKAFAVDPIVPELLVFPAGYDLHDHPLVESGVAILQDKASCFPAMLLAPPADCDVIDTCAAPGNKTSHLAALMHNRARLFAWERDPSRYQLLQDRLVRAGVTNVHGNLGDFLETDPCADMFSNVWGILVDPTCSGSGMRKVRAELSGKGRDKDALEKARALSQFQVRLVKHAMSFPSVRRVVYSTCSVYAEENEEVVRQVLIGEMGGVFKLVSALPDVWERRGQDGLEECVRLSEEDRTNGFFAAVFERI